MKLLTLSFKPNETDSRTIAVTCAKTVAAIAFEQATKYEQRLTEEDGTEINDYDKLVQAIEDGITILCDEGEHSPTVFKIETVELNSVKLDTDFFSTTLRDDLAKADALTIDDTSIRHFNTYTNVEDDDVYLDATDEFQFYARDIDNATKSGNTWTLTHSDTGETYEITCEVVAQI